MGCVNLLYRVNLNSQNLDIHFLVMCAWFHTPFIVSSTEEELQCKIGLGKLKKKKKKSKKEVFEVVPGSDKRTSTPAIIN